MTVGHHLISNELTISDASHDALTFPHHGPLALEGLMVRVY
jgi:hypothetical protein